MKPGDLVYYQAQGFNCHCCTDSDGPATMISLSYYPENGKSSDYAEIFLHWKGQVLSVWRKQVGLLKEKNDGSWRHCKNPSYE